MFVSQTTSTVFKSSKSFVIVCHISCDKVGIGGILIEISVRSCSLFGQPVKHVTI